MVTQCHNITFRIVFANAHGRQILDVQSTTSLLLISHEARPFDEKLQTVDRCVDECEGL